MQNNMYEKFEQNDYPFHFSTPKEIRISVLVTNTALPFLIDRLGIIIYPETGFSIIAYKN